MSRVFTRETATIVLHWPCVDSKQLAIPATLVIQILTLTTECCLVLGSWPIDMSSIQTSMQLVEPQKLPAAPGRLLQNKYVVKNVCCKIGSKSLSLRLCLLVIHNIPYTKNINLQCMTLKLSTTTSWSHTNDFSPKPVQIWVKHL